MPFLRGSVENEFNESDLNPVQISFTDMTIGNQQTFGNPDPSQPSTTKKSQAKQHTDSQHLHASSKSEQIQSEPSDMSLAMNSLWQGFSGLLFAVSIIFLLGSPLISVGILGFLFLAHTGKTVYSVRQTINDSSNDSSGSADSVPTGSAPTESTDKGDD